MSVQPLRPITGKYHFPLAGVVENLSKRPLLYFLAIELLLVGAWAEDVWGSDFFSRSGAAIALFALLLLWLWLRYSEEQRKTEELIHALKPIKMPDTSSFGILTAAVENSRKHPNVPIESSFQIAALNARVKNEGPELNSRLKNVTRSLGYAQVEVAGLGTFVWAFGDLLV